MVNELRGRRLLDGVRGAPAYDVDALVVALCRLSDLAAARAGSFETIEVNPMLLLPRGRGVLALDAHIATASCGDPIRP